MAPDYSPMTTPPIGLIGVGLLGTALSERMLAGGWSVLGCDLRPEQLERLEQLGGRRAASAAEVAGCGSIVLCLPDSAVVAAVVGELAGRLQPGTLLLDATTGDPDATAALAGQLRSGQIGY